MPKCKKCETKIIFIQMVTGGIMPCDAELHIITLNPSSKQSFIVPVLNGGKELGKTLRGYIDPNGKIKGYMPHWATCPEAQTFKNKEARNDT